MKNCGDGGEGGSRAGCRGLRPLPGFGAAPQTCAAAQPRRCERPKAARKRGSLHPHRFPHPGRRASSPAAHLFRFGRVCPPARRNQQSNPTSKGANPPITIEHNGAQLRVAELGGELRGYQATPPEPNTSGAATLPCGRACRRCCFRPSARSGTAARASRACAIPVPRHGFARGAALPRHRAGRRLHHLTLTETAETRRLYPFDFALSVTHRLCGDGFETRFTVENHTGRDMPFLIGGHPASPVPWAGRAAFEDYVLRFEKPEDGHELMRPRHPPG